MRLLSLATQIFGANGKGQNSTATAWYNSKLALIPQRWSKG